MKCNTYNQYCSDHGFHHGAEANELREGLEKLIEDRFGGREEEETVEIWELQRLLDRVDARDSLAYLEAKDEDTEISEELG